MNKAYGELIQHQTLNGVIDRATDYNGLANKPRIENVELRGNRTFEELGMVECTNQDIEDMFKKGN